MLVFNVIKPIKRFCLEFGYFSSLNEVFVARIMVILIAPAPNKPSKPPIYPHFIQLKKLADFECKNFQLFANSVSRSILSKKSPW